MLKYQQEQIKLVNEDAKGNLLGQSLQQLSFEEASLISMDIVENPGNQERNNELKSNLEFLLKNEDQLSSFYR